MTDPNEMGPCIVCNKVDARICNRCKSARYCSTTCQHADWPTHKLLCASFSKFDISNRPTDEHIRAIFFPVDTEKPKLIWLHSKWCDDDDGSRFQLPEIEAYMGPNTFSCRVPIPYNPVLERQLSDTIQLCYRDTFLFDGSKPNSSVAAITTTKPGQYHDWRGPIIAYANAGPGVNQATCKDFDMGDFRRLTDYFLWYNYKPPPATQQSNDAKIKGVKINCIGDQKMFNKPGFEAVELVSTDLIFSKHDTSEITKRIGLPIFTRRCPPHSKWANDLDNEIFERKSPFNNQYATFLHLCCDPKVEPDLRAGSLGWGWASMQWQNRVGSVIVVCQDKKPLLPLHVEALCKYCFDEIRPLLAHSIGEYEPEEPMGKDAVLAMTCRPTSIIHWHKLLEEKHEAGEDTDVPSPYDM